jgi:hypothetical protein
MKNWMKRAVFLATFLAVLCIVCIAADREDYSVTWLRVKQLKKLGSNTTIQVDDPIDMGTDALKADTISESTSAAGVTIDSATKVKDGEIYYSGTDGTDRLEGARLLGHIANTIVYVDDFLECGGYATDAATTNAAADKVYGAKFSETANYGTWLVTNVDGDSDEAEAITIEDDAPGGWLKIVPNNKAADSIECQMNGEMFKLATGKQLWFETKLAVTDADQQKWFIGLATADTDILGGYPNDHFGFKCDGDASIDITCEQDNTNITYDTSLDVVDNVSLTNAVILAAHWDGAGTIYTYVVDAVGGTTLSANTNVVDNGTTVCIPNDEAMALAICNECEDTGADGLLVDYVKIIQER